MITQLEEELIDFKEKLEKVNEWVKKIPLFKDIIINDKFTGDENWLKYTSRYKAIRLDWGVNRGLYGSSRVITNYDGEHNGYLWNIYVNKLTIFGDIGSSVPIDDDIDCFFFDHMNTTYYCTDDQIENLLESLNAWYLKEKDNVDAYKKENKIKRLEQELAKLKAT